MKFSFEKGLSSEGKKEKTIENIFEATRDKLSDRLERWSQEERVERFRDELLKKYPELQQETLSLLSDLSVEVSALFHEGYLDEQEATFLLSKLLKSKGRDNLTTFSILVVLGERLQTKRMDNE